MYIAIGYEYLLSVVNVVGLQTKNIHPGKLADRQRTVTALKSGTGHNCVNRSYDK